MVSWAGSRQENLLWGPAGPLSTTLMRLMNTVIFRLVSHTPSVRDPAPLLKAKHYKRMANDFECRPGLLTVPMLAACRSRVRILPAPEGSIFGRFAGARRCPPTQRMSQGVSL